MEVDVLLSGSRWQIIQAIAEKPSSPVEIASKIGTTVANVSAQFRLLEAAGLVTKTRLKTSQAGKPRILYSLKDNQVFIARLCSPQAAKTLRQLTAFERIMTALLEIDLSSKKHLFSYALRYARQLEQATIGFAQDGNTTIIGVVGEHSLPNNEDKPYRIIVRKVPSLDGFTIRIGERK